MQILKRGLLIIVVPIFTFLLFSIATTSLLVKQAGSPEPVKKLVADSGIYNSVVKGLLDESGAVNNNGNEVSLDNAIVKNAAEKAFSPEFIQSSTENVIDSVYRWLDGSTPEPDFRIDLASVKTAFANNISSELTTKLASLPACTSTPADFDALNAECLPVGITPAAATSEVRDDILKGQGFLDHPVITPESIKKEGVSQSVFTNQLKDAPKAFQTLKSAPILLGVLSLVFALMVIFLSSNILAGFKKVGFSLISVGILMLVLGLTINWAAKHTDLEIKLNNKVLASKLQLLAENIGKKIGDNYWQFGAGYTALGITAVAGSVYFKRRKGKSKAGLKGEGRTKEDRIELREPVQAIALEDDIETIADAPHAQPEKLNKEKTKSPNKTPAKSSPAKTPTKPKPAPKKIIIQ